MHKTMDSSMLIDSSINSTTSKKVSKKCYLIGFISVISSYFVTFGIGNHLSSIRCDSDGSHSL